MAAFSAMLRHFSIRLLLRYYFVYADGLMPPFMATDMICR